METTNKPESHVRLTDSFATQTPVPAKGKRLIYDTTFSNFVLRITAAGARSWIVRTSIAGKNIERTIGSIKLYSATRAREIAIEICGELRQGVDRFQQAKERAQADTEAKKQAITISEGLDQYLERRTLKERTIADYEGLVKNELGEHSNMPLRDVTREFAEKLHVSITKSRGATRANKAIGLLQTLCTNLELGLQSWRRFPKAKISARRTKLIPEHGRVIWESLEGKAASSGANFLRALLLTGCRSGELKTLTVEQVSIRNRTISLPTTKSHIPHVIRMSDQLVALISPLLVDKEADDLVFSVAGDPRNSVKTAKEAVGVHFSPHDLRKLFAITLNSLGTPYPTIKACLNHSAGNDVTLSAYAHPTANDMAIAWQTASDLYTGRSGITSLNTVRSAVA